MNSNTKTLIISIVAVAIFIACIVATSYAFYTSQTKTESEDVSFSNITAEVETTLKDDDVIDVTMIPGDSFEKTFSISNKGPDLKFYISVLDLENNFTHPEDVTYVLTEDDVEKGKGTFPNTKGNADLSGNELVIKDGETKTYKVKITYTNDPKRDQSDDMGKKISGKIFIRRS